jgi:hypothetical protein
MSLSVLFPNFVCTKAIFISIPTCLVFVLLSLTAGGRPLLLLPQQVLPLDPLTPEEIALATSLADADSRVEESLGHGRTQLIQVQFVALKLADGKSTQERELSRRHAAVLFYRYDTDQGIYVVIDLQQRSIGEITKLEGRAVPLAVEEVSRAFALALLNKRVRTLLGPEANKFGVAGLPTGAAAQNRVEGLRVMTTSPRDPCYRHRCIELHFRKREGYLPATSVMVDLSAQKVKVQNTPR